MRISLLLQREPFGAILEKTLSQFLHSKFNKDHRVTWEAKKPWNFQDNPGTWLCNPYLNVIFTPTSLRNNFKPIMNEYNYSIVPWRRPLQRMYCALATHSLTAQYFSKYCVNITPNIPRFDNLIIIGGNHRIRLLDRQQGKCYVINKVNFNSSRTMEEIKFRQSETSLPIPEIVEVASSQTWYAEQYISGTPVNRISCQKIADRMQTQALNHIRQLAQKTSREESLIKYSLKLNDKIKAHIKTNRRLDARQKQQLQECSSTLLQLLTRLDEDVLSTIATSQTHGDFQPGNILVDKGEVWLIDWEYTRRRQSGYDALVHHLQSRFGAKFQTNLQKAIKGDIKGLQSWPGLTLQNEKQRIVTLALFLFEELDLYLEENDNHMFTQLSGGMASLLSNINAYLEIIENHD